MTERFWLRAIRMTFISPPVQLVLSSKQMACEALLTLFEMTGNCSLCSWPCPGLHPVKLDLLYLRINHPGIKSITNILWYMCRQIPDFLLLFVTKWMSGEEGKVEGRRSGWGHCSIAWNNRRPLASTSGQPKLLTKDTELTHNELLQWEGRL